MQNYILTGSLVTNKTLHSYKKNEPCLDVYHTYYNLWRLKIISQMDMEVEVFSPAKHNFLS